MNKSNTPTLAILGLAAIGALGSAQAALVNGGFETGNLNGWMTLGSVSASGAVSYSGVGSVDPDSGDFAARMSTAGVPVGTIASTMGLTESALESFNADMNATNGSLIYQTVSAVAGDTFQFRWNFVEHDYLPFDDWAFYGIKFNNGPTLITKFASLGEVGPGSGSTINGWESLGVDITQSGDYTFYFGVMNVNDQMLDSELWLDGASVGGNPESISAIPEPGSALALGLLVGSGAFLRQRRKR